MRTNPAIHRNFVLCRFPKVGRAAPFALLTCALAAGCSSRTDTQAASSSEHCSPNGATEASASLASFARRVPVWRCASTSYRRVTASRRH